MLSYLAFHWPCRRCHSSLSACQKQGAMISSTCPTKTCSCLRSGQLHCSTWPCNCTSDQLGFTCVSRLLVPWLGEEGFFPRATSGSGCCPWGLPGLQHYCCWCEAVASTTGATEHLLSAQISTALFLDWTQLGSESLMLLKLKSYLCQTTKGQGLAAGRGLAN